MRQLADTFIVVDKVNTGATILTRIVRTVVDIRLAVSASITSQTLATVPVQVIFASASMLTGIGSALVNVCLASLATVAWQTVADELIDTIFAGAAVYARIAGALVHVAQTSSVVVASGTLAPVPIDQVYTSSAIGTGITGALVYVCLAVLTREPWLALARVSGSKSIVSTEDGRYNDVRVGPRFCQIRGSCDRNCSRLDLYFGKWERGWVINFARF